MPHRPSLPTIEVEIDWLEPPTDPGAPAIAMPEPMRRDTIPVEPEWLEVEDAPAPKAPRMPKLPRSMPRLPAKSAVEGASQPTPGARGRSSPPPKGSRAKKSSAPPKRRG